MYIVNTIQNHLELISTYPIVLQIALYFILFNSIVALTLVTFIYGVRNRKRKEEKIEDEIFPRQKDFLLNELLSKDLVSSESIYEKFTEEFGKLNKRTYASLISALEELVKKDAYLLSSKNYPSIIKGLEIEDFLVKKLEFSNTRKRLSTFKSLSALNLTVADSFILPHTYSKNRFLRKESRNSYLAISSHDPFKFFDHADNNLNHWDQINLLQQLEMHHKHNLPNFSKWIQYSKNNSQLSFIIKAVNHFKQKSSVTALINLIDTEDHTIRKEVIEALGEMHVIEAEEKLVDVYNNQPIACQNAIIKAIVTINSGKSLNFLKTNYINMSNLDSKKLLAEAIYKYNSEGRLFIENLHKQEVGFNRLILDHIKNPLIPSRLSSSKKTTANRQDEQYEFENLNISI